ncbi:hypothetical protein ACO0RG_004357 [Hanseniaspora osmophila]
MGQILSNPDIRKESEKMNDKFTAYGVCSMQGWRMSMEDQHITQLSLKPSAQDALQNFNDQLAFYAVFDGHGGSSIAEFSGNNVNLILSRELNSLYKKQNNDKKNDSKGDSSVNNNNNDNNHMNNSNTNNDRDQYAQAMIDCFLHTDEEILKDKILKMDHSGCTATSVLISKQYGKIVCANSGDSRTVLSSGKYAKNLSFDHKPTNAGEKARIFNAGGFVEMSRVNGNLALSRAIGDFEFKQNNDLPPHEQIVTVVPDILEHKIDYTNDEFVILACDGIWDCLTSQECVDLIHYGIHKENILDLGELSSKIIDVCCSPDAGGQGIGCDNMSMMIVALLKNEESVDEWFTRMKSKSYDLDKEINFETYRKKIFNYFQFNNENIFAVTNPATYSNSNNAGGMNRMGGLSNGGLGSLIRPRMNYGDEEDDDEEEDDEEEEDPDYEEDMGAHHAVTLKTVDKKHAKKGTNNSADDQVEVAIDEEPMDEDDENNSNGNSDSKQIVLNLDDFLKNNGSLTRDENGMTYIQGHILSEVLESLVHKRQGTDKAVESDEQVKNDSEDDKEK